MLGYPQHAIMGGSFTSPPLPPPPRGRSIEDLPTDTMISVLERLSIVDRVRFASLCSSFYSIFRAAQQLHLSKTTTPWMLLPSQSTPDSVAFFSISDGRIYRIPQEEEEEGRCRRSRLLFLGSSDGWLVTLDQGCSQLYLLNPITGTKIHLPPLPSSKLVSLESSKAVLSWSCSSLSPSYTVVLLLLARHSSSTWPTALVCCSQQQAWTPFGRRREFYSDAAMSNSYLYTMQSNGTVEAWDLAGGPSLSRTIVMPKSVSMGFASFTKYLVLVKDDGGGLLQVWRYREFAKVEFKVFKLEEEEEWVEVKSLDGRVLFLNSCCCSSMSVMSEDCPPELGANNSIYFDRPTTSSSSKNSRESMVFRMEDGSVERLLLLHGSIWEPSPIWIVPTLLHSTITSSRGGAWY